MAKGGFNTFIVTKVITWSLKQPLLKWHMFAKAVGREKTWTAKMASWLLKQTRIS